MNEELQNLLGQARENSQEAKMLFGHLSEAQLNWKPNAESWSVGQCLEHLIKTNDEVLGVADSHIKGIHKKTFFEKLPFLPAFFGSQILKAVQPENAKKNKAPKIFAPAKSAVSEHVVEEFLESQNKIIRLIEASRNIDLAKTVITSPVAKIVTYSLLDAYKIVLIHEQRHFAQAKRVVQLNGFPK